jgi:hypothetical protein
MASATRGRNLLLLAGLASSAMALFHLSIVVMGAPAYRRMGGEELARRAATSWQPAAMVLTVALVFGLFALYAFVGARPWGRLPFLRTGLVLVSVLYAIHGLFVLPAAASRLMNTPSPVPSSITIDAIFLAMALPYILGTAAAWPDLDRRAMRGA